MLAAKAVDRHGTQSKTMVGFVSLGILARVAFDFDYERHVTQSRKERKGKIRKWQG